MRLACVIALRAGHCLRAPFLRPAAARRVEAPPPALGRPSPSLVRRLPVVIRACFFMMTGVNHRDAQPPPSACLILRLHFRGEKLPDYVFRVKDTSGRVRGALVQVIDDEADICEMLPCAGGGRLAVRWRWTARPGWRWAQARRPALVFLDIKMPRLNAIRSWPDAAGCGPCGGAGCRHHLVTEGGPHSDEAGRAPESAETLTSPSARCCVDVVKEILRFRSKALAKVKDEVPYPWGWAAG